jgi:hypothetical protein
MLKPSGAVKKGKDGLGGKGALRQKSGNKCLTRWTGYLLHELEAEPRSMAVEDFGQLRSTLVGVLKGTLDAYVPELPTAPIDALQLFKDIAYLSRTFFGAEFLLIHEQQAATPPV